MKLHIGCGKKILEGYENIDLPVDVRYLSKYYDNAEEILAVHVVEHFYITEIESIFSNWYSVLNKGGKLVIELPCWDKVIQHIKDGSPENFTRWPLYGEPRTHVDGEPALHKWCYSKKEMRTLLGMAGFKEVKEETPLYHQPTRDMRFIAWK